VEFITRAGKSPKPHPLEAMVHFQVREAHLGTLSLVSRFGECLGLHLLSCDVASIFMEIAWDVRASVVVQHLARIADSDEVARAFRNDVARRYEMMPPGIRCLAGG
jgi:hypothetical protein